MKITFKSGDELPAGLTEVIDSDGDKWVRQGDSDTFVYDNGEGNRVADSWSYLTNSYSGSLTGEVPDSVTDAPATPRTFRIYPECPADVKRVRSTTEVHSSETVYERVGDSDMWVDSFHNSSAARISWKGLLDRHNVGGLVEVAETPHAAAVRRLRENRNPRMSNGVTVYEGRAADIDTVIRELVGA